MKSRTITSPATVDAAMRAAMIVDRDAIATRTAKSARVDRSAHQLRVRLSTANGRVASMSSLSLRASIMASIYLTARDSAQSLLNCVEVGLMVRRARGRREVGYALLPATSWSERSRSERVNSLQAVLVWRRARKTKGQMNGQAFGVGSSSLSPGFVVSLRVGRTSAFGNRIGRTERSSSSDSRSSMVWSHDAEKATIDY
jgi:hypothetical protein